MSWLTLGGLAASILLPLIANHKGGGIWSKIKGSLGNILSSPKASVTGLAAGAWVYTILNYFPCLKDAGAWEKLALAAVPAIYGLLTKSAGTPIPPFVPMK